MPELSLPAVPPMDGSARFGRCDGRGLQGLGIWGRDGISRERSDDASSRPLPGSRQALPDGPGRVTRAAR